MKTQKQTLRDLVKLTRGSNFSIDVNKLDKLDNENIFDLIEWGGVLKYMWLEIIGLEVRDENKKVDFLKLITGSLKELNNKKVAKEYSMPIFVFKSHHSDDANKYLLNPKYLNNIDVCLLNKEFEKPKRGLKPWGCKKGENPPKGYYNINLKKHNKYYALDDVLWSKIIDTEVIIDKKVKHLSNDAILGEILWVMTFNGYTEKECQKNIKKMEQMLNERIEKL